MERPVAPLRKKGEWTRRGILSDRGEFRWTTPTGGGRDQAQANSARDSWARTAETILKLHVIKVEAVNLSIGSWWHGWASTRSSVVAVAIASFHVGGRVHVGGRIALEHLYAGGME